MATIVYLEEASIKCYQDYECTKEFTKEDSAYIYHLGPTNGLNGTDGDYITQTFFIKNVGETEANNVFIEEVGDLSNIFKLGTPGSNICTEYLPVGTLLPNEVKQILIYILVPEGCTAVEEGYINYNIYYNTVPVDDSTILYQDAEDYDTLLLNNISDTAYEYTLKSLQDTLEIPMKEPVRVIYGAKDQVKFDQEHNYYTIRLQCPNCNTWTNWYKLDTFDVHKGVICSSCAKPVCSSININTIGKENGEHTYDTKKIDFSESSWLLNTNTNLYELTLEESGTVLNTYKRNDSGTYGLVLVNSKKDNGKVIVTSKNKFTGHLVLAKNIFGNVLSKLGRSYGYGPFGNSNYGQEGLVKITDSVDMEVPISGQKVVNIVASYTILAKYTGKEANIEDIQSFYTERYVMLGCYDGPALPLWLEDTY